MTEVRYPKEEDVEDDDGTMQGNVDDLAKEIIGHKIVSAEKLPDDSYYRSHYKTVLTLDNGKRVILTDSSDCCAYTYLDKFLMDPRAVDHMILGVGTTDEFSTWHIYADFGDVMKLEVGWSCGNPFYYGYGFDIRVEEEK